MKYLLIAFIALLLLGCSSTKESTTTTTRVDTLIVTKDGETKILYQTIIDTVYSDGKTTVVRDTLWKRVFVHSPAETIKVNIPFKETIIKEVTVSWIDSVGKFIDKIIIIVVIIGLIMLVRLFR